MSARSTQDACPDIDSDLGRKEGEKGEGADQRVVNAVQQLSSKAAGRDNAAPPPSKSHDPVSHLVEETSASSVRFFFFFFSPQQPF